MPRGQKTTENLHPISGPTPAHAASSAYTAEEISNISAQADRDASLSDYGFEGDATAPKDVPRDRPVEVESGVSVDSRLLASDETAQALGLKADDPFNWDDLSPEEHAAAIKALKERPIGTMSQKLALPPKRGYHRHWFNDQAGRVADALASGWRHVRDEAGKPIKRVVGSGRDGGALLGYAMEIPETIFAEDMARRHKAAYERVAATKQKPFQAPPGSSQRSDRGKFYDPHEESGRGPIDIRGPVEF